MKKLTLTLVAASFITGAIITSCNTPVEKVEDAKKNVTETTKIMNYHFNKTIESSMENAVEKVTAELKKEGFGILMDIDMQKIFKEKINVDFRPYRILGTCNPTIGHNVLQIDDVMGVFLPCHIVVQDAGNGKIKVSSIDPIAPMSAVANPELEPIGMEVQSILKKVIERL